MAERKVPCPETDSDCTSPECSKKICVLRQERILRERRMAEWEAQFRSDLANREAAAWRAINELVAEHNALIDANEIGIATNRIGEVYRTRIKVPERERRGSKRFVTRVLTSKRPDIVARLRNAMDAILVEARNPF